ncbi:MAG: phosphoglycerate kinase, partial [Bacteroidales bacterium]|nr:phosphoglycerate kinase [Bacteroidales bacterium]
MQQHIDSYDFTGKKAIVRVDFNVPLDENFNITDDTRIRRAMPTLKKVLEKGGSLIIMSHLGRPKKVDPKFSLKHIVDHVSECLGVPVQFAEDCMKADAQAAALKPGEALLLENLRFYAEEEGKPRGLAEDASEEEKKAAKKAVKESQKEFVKKLASYADCYINDAFGTAHRAHASTALIADYFPNDKMFGYLMEGEIKAIDNVLKNAQRPLTAIIGGSKVSTKLTVLHSLSKIADLLIVGGGIANTFIAAQGNKVGKSLSENDLVDEAAKIAKETKIPEVVDVVTGKEFSESAAAETK